MLRQACPDGKPHQKPDGKTCQNRSKESIILAGADADTPTEFAKYAKVSTWIEDEHKVEFIPVSTELPSDNGTDYLS